MEELFEVAKQIEEIKIALDSARSAIFVLDPSITAILDSAFRASALLDKVLDKLEDLEMEDVDFANINLDKAFEGNPVSDYVQAGLDYVCGDETAIGRMVDAAAKISEHQKGETEEMEYLTLSPTEALKAIKEGEDEHYTWVNEVIEGIEDYFTGSDIDKWEEDDVELARYVLRHNANTAHFEVDMLTPHGVQLAWKRRRYMGAAK